MISILITLIIIGVLLYLLQLVPMDAVIKKIIYVLVILFVVLWLLSLFGFVPAGFGGQRFPHGS